MKRPIYFSIALAGSLALGGLLTVLPPLPFALPSTQLACHGKGQCDLQQPLEKPPYFREDEGSLREMSLIQPIPGEFDSYIEFNCLVCLTRLADDFMVTKTRGVIRRDKLAIRLNLYLVWIRDRVVNLTLEFLGF